MPLNPTQVKSLQAGNHADGNGLYLVVRDADRAWAFRFTAPDGKRAQMEFAKAVDKATGRADEMTLKEARDAARDYRIALKRDGIDPRVKKRAIAIGGKTFKQYAEEKYPGWCIGKCADEPKQWQRSINDVASLHDLKLHEIDNPQVIEALKPIWSVKPVTANRTRQRLERLLNAAKVEKLRSGENPATWRGNLEHVFTSSRKLNVDKRQRTGRSKGHLSLPYDKVPALLTALRYDGSVVARCVEVGILTVARSQEIRLMEWDEINKDKKQWLVPAAKMKIKGQDEPKDHLVPLSEQALAIIMTMPRKGRYVFPSDHADTHQPFRPNALVGVITRAGFKATQHGTRTSFRNWGGESVKHNFRREVLEHCLSHRVGDEAELSYWTGDMIERRRVALQAWADYVMPKTRKASLQLVA
jgi:integrase